MPYDRFYTLSEVGRILYESEGRPRPTTGQAGHPLGRHGDLREDVADRRYRRVILLAETLEATRAMRPEDGVGVPIAPASAVPKDGKFLGRADMIRAVHEALNAPGGQQALRRLNGADRTVTISARIVANRGRLRAAVCQHPVIDAGTGNRPRPIFVEGPSFYREGFATDLVLVVDRLPGPNPACDIHIQTAYPSRIEA
jgi:hypothetical protein